MNETDYEKYRGKCKEMSEDLIKERPELTLVRGHYHSLNGGYVDQHWWTKDKEGNIVDPTKKQFPCKGMGDYVEFNGIISCEECGKEVKEEEASFAGRFPVCSSKCHSELIGLGEFYRE